MGAYAQEKARQEIREDAEESTPIYDAVAEDLPTDLIKHTEPLPMPTFATTKIAKAS